MLRARSRRIRRSIFPLGLLGISSMKTTPPASRLYEIFASATCYHNRAQPVNQCAEVKFKFRAHLHQTRLDVRFALWVLCKQFLRVCAQNDEGQRDLAVILVWNTHHAGICYICMIQQVPLELRWRDFQVANQHLYQGRSDKGLRGTDLETHLL